MFWAAAESPRGRRSGAASAAPTVSEVPHRGVMAGGIVFIVDQCDDIRDDAQGDTEGIFQKRRVGDGRVFTIVKVYYHPALLAARLNQFGFDAAAQRIGESFFSICGQKR